MKNFLFIILLLSLRSFAGVTEWIDFELENGFVKIPISISGIDTHAILDTGAQVNAINKHFIKKNNLSFNSGPKINIKGVYGVSKRNSFNNVPISFFGIQTELDDIVEISLGYQDDGFLFGAGFFSEFVTQIDYPNSKMRLITHDSIDVGKFKNIDVRRDKGSGMPIVKVGLSEDKQLWLLLDTGNSGGMLVERRVASAMGWLDNLDSSLHMSSGANSSMQTESFRIPTLHFGPFQLENVLVSVPDEGKTANIETQFQETGSRIKGKRIQGLIGYDVLKHFLITIDYKKGYAHVGLPQ